jgi:hypothetical protein
MSKFVTDILPLDRNTNTQFGRLYEYDNSYSNNTWVDKSHILPLHHWHFSNPIFSSSNSFVIGDGGYIPSFMYNVSGKAARIVPAVIGSGILVDANNSDYYQTDGTCTEPWPYIYEDERINFNGFTLSMWYKLDRRENENYPIITRDIDSPPVKIGVWFNNSSFYVRSTGRLYT